MDAPWHPHQQEGMVDISATPRAMTGIATASLLSIHAAETQVIDHEGGDKTATASTLPTKSASRLKEQEHATSTTDVIGSSIVHTPLLPVTWAADDVEVNVESTRAKGEEITFKKIDASANDHRFETDVALGNQHGRQLGQVRDATNPGVKAPDFGMTRDFGTGQGQTVVLPHAQQQDDYDSRCLERFKFISISSEDESSVHPNEIPREGLSLHNKDFPYEKVQSLSSEKLQQGSEQRLLRATCPKRTVDPKARDLVEVRAHFLNTSM